MHSSTQAHVYIYPFYKDGLDTATEEGTVVPRPLRSCGALIVVRMYLMIDYVLMRYSCRMCLIVTVIKFALMRS